MFPTQDVDITQTIQQEANTSAANKITFEFDFANGDFIVKDGKIKEVTGIDGLQLWIQKILSTEKDKYAMYETYGANIFEYMASNFPYAFIKAQIEKEIKEVLSQNSNIKSITDFIFTKDRRTLTVNFTVNSIYGISTSEVII